jgi:hypothetical protein
MTTKTRRIVSLCGAALILLFTLAPILGIPGIGHFMLWLWVGGLSLLGAANALIPPGSPGQNLNTSMRSAFESLSFCSLGLAASLSVVYYFWDRRPTKTAVTVSYFVFLLVLMSMSTANFSAGDMLLNRKAQALIDLVLVILGFIVVIDLLQIRPRSTTGVVLRAVTVFLITLQGIATPGFLGLFWLLNWENIISKTATEHLNPAWFSAAAGMVSAIVAMLNFQSTRNKLKDDKTSESRIIIP